MATCLTVENVGKCAFFNDDEIMIIDKYASDVTKSGTVLKSPITASSPETINGNKKCSKSESKQVYILSADFSSCGTFLVTCDSNYRVNLWKKEENTWSILSTRYSTRKCQKVIFSNLLYDIILADRGGDVFKFSSSELSKEGEFILGHISFITDICISSNDKYLATCDRDGKIRISNYPNCYNIHSYCLGHTMFISSAAFLENKLISGSGDGTLKLWDLSGNEKECENLCQNITIDCEKKGDTLLFTEDPTGAGCLSKENLQFSVQCFKFDMKKGLLAVIFHFLKGVAVYKLSDCKFQMKQLIKLSYRVKEVIFLQNNNLLIISRDVPITFCEFAINPETSCYTLCAENQVSEFTQEVQKFFNGFENALNFADDDLMLFKKNYDNDEQEEPKSKKNKM